ncbi:hypothetical protein BDP81DRAFT_418489, partial [Colletotrichum phormii]
MSCKPAPHPVSIHSERPPPILPCCRPTALRLSVNLYPYGAFVPGFCFLLSVPPGGFYRLCWLVRFSLRIHPYL